jgi:C-terminal processing protease CtpA/Prc
MYYDTEVENLMKLGEMALERKDYERAYACYNKAFELDPKSDRAKEGLTYVQGYMARKAEFLKEKDVQRMAAYEESQQVGMAGRAEGEVERKIGQLANITGLTLTMTGGAVKAENVSYKSAAYLAGIRRGDTLVAVWGRLIGYMGFEEVLDLLLKQVFHELKLTIEKKVKIEVSDDRNIMAGPAKLIGASFSMEFDGLTISEVNKRGTAETAGAQKRDLVVAIDGASTRYMPIKDAINRIRLTKSKFVVLTIRRQVTVWKQVSIQT